MHNFTDNREVGFCANIKLALNCLHYHPNIDDWYFNINNPLYGTGNIWEKYIIQNTLGNSVLNWNQEFNKISFEENGTVKSTDWILGYDSNERDKFESKDFVKTFKELITQLKFTDEIHEEINKYSLLIDSNTVGIHIRMRDHLNEGHGYKQEDKLELDSIINTIKNQTNKVFVISDNAEVYDRFQSSIENVIFIDNKKQYSNNKLGLHYQPLNEEEKNYLLKILLVEINLLSKCSCINKIFILLFFAPNLILCKQSTKAKTFK